MAMGGLSLKAAPVDGEGRTDGFVLGRQPALDGVRAIAIIAVMLFHAGWRRAEGGYLGVDVFFVLSGFLITALLVQERSGTGRISLLAFYKRRARRLLPALVLLLIAATIYGLALPNNIENQRMWLDEAAALFYFSNWVAAFGNWEVGMVAHTWSLAIEEQFYLLWPALFVAMLWRGVRRWTVLGLLCAGILASAAVRWVGIEESGVTTPRLAFALDTRGGALLVGCLLGVLVGWGLVPLKLRRFGSAFAVGGLAVLLVAFLSKRYAGAPPEVYTEGFTLVAFATAVVVLGVIMAPQGWVARCLSNRAFVWIGRVSYGLYLWHVPINVALRPGNITFGLSGAGLQVLRLLLTLAVTTASFYLIEQPVLHGQRPRLPALGRWRASRPGAPDLSTAA
jgi:peptidoglycan/LPS O-acetylase OafA/YrhL